MSSNKKIILNNGEPMISARKVAKHLQCAPDYVGKLCREGKLEGKLIDNAWFVSQSSIVVFEKSRSIAKEERAKELAEERRKENQAYRKANGLPAIKKPLQAGARFSLHSAAGLVLGSALLFAAVVFAGAVQKPLGNEAGSFFGMPPASVAPQQNVAALAQVQSPFFAIAPASLPLPSQGNFFSDVFAYLFGSGTSANLAVQKSPALPSTAQQVLPAQSSAQSSPQKQTVVENITQPVIQKTIVETESGVTQADLTTQLGELSNSLKQIIYANDSAQNSLPATGGYTNNIALAQKIDQLSGVAISNSTLSNSTLSGITISDQLSVNGSGTSTFNGGINIASGCLSINGVCVGSGGGSANATGTPGLIQFTDGSVLAADSNLSFSTSTETLTTDNLSIASTLSLTSGGFGNCTLTTNPSGTVMCGSGGGGGSDGNWVFFNGSGIHLATTTNQVLIGGTATTSLAALEVRPQGSSPAAYFAGNVGIGTTSPFAAFSLAGNAFITGTLTATNITATGTLTATNLSINGSTFTSLLGTGLANNAGVLTVSTTSLGLLGSSSLSAAAPLGYDALTGAFTITQSNTSANGYLSSGDFTTFENKISSTSLSGGSGISYNSATGVITNLIGYDFPNNATSTQIAFNTGLTATNILASGSTTLQNFTANFATTSQATTTNLAISSVASSLLKTLSNGAVVAAQAGVDYQAAGNYATFAYPFPNNATSTLLSFTGGLNTTNLLASASTTLQNFTGINATTTQATTTALAISGISSSLLKTLGNGAVVPAVVGVDYQAAGNYDTFAYLFPSNATSTLLQFNGGASTTAFTVNGTASTTALVVSNLGGSGTTCVQADAAGNLSSTDAACGTGSGAVYSVTASNGTLTISPNTGAVLASLNLSNANTWSALQTFGNILVTGSSTLQDFTANNATTSQATTTSLAISNITSSLLKTLLNGAVVAAQAGVDYATPANIASAFPFTSVPTFGATLANSTSTLIGFSNGIYALASSTIGNGTQAGGLTISGGATTTGNAYFASNITAAGTLQTLNILASASTTLQNFTGINATTTQATTTALAISGISSSLLKTLSNGAVVPAIAGSDYLTAANVFGYPFPNNATSTLLAFNGGLTAAGATSTSLAVTGSTTISSQLNALGGATLGSATVNALTLNNALSVGNGGTGSTSLAGILVGSTTLGQIQTLVVGSGLTFDGTTLATAGTGITAIGPLNQTQTGGTQTLATTTSSFNGLTAGITIVGSSNTQTFTPTFSGTLNNSGLTNSSLSVNAGAGLTGGGSVSLGGSTSLSLDLTANNIWTGLQQFANASSSVASAYSAFFGATATSSFSSTGALTLVSALAVGSGGTGNSSYSPNSLLYYNGSGIVSTSSQALYVGSLFATTSSATSTFNGGLSAAGSLFVLQNGNIGVGNSSPAKTFDVTGTGRFSSTLTLSGGATLNCAGGQALQTNSSGDIACGAVNVSGASTGGGWHTDNIGDITLATTSDRVAIGAATSSPYAKLVISSDWPATTTLALLPASGQTADIIDIYNSAGALNSVLTAGGSLGLGSTSPASRLAVNGGAYITGNTTAGGTLTTSNLVSTSSVASSFVGSVGIGTSSPMSALSLAGGDFTQVALGNPAMATSVPVVAGAQSFKIFVSGNYAYEAEYQAGLRIFDISNPDNPVLLGTYSGSSAVDQVIVAGKYAYLADASAGVEILDVSNPSSPVALSTYPLSTLPYNLGIALSGKYLFAADLNNHAVRVLDVSNPQAPALAGSWVGSGTNSPRALAVLGKYLYVADYAPAVYALDISNPAAPFKVGSSYTTGLAGPNSIYASGAYIYVADVSGKGLTILNASNPASLSLAGSYNPGGSKSYDDVTVAGNYAYLADDAGNLAQIDISNKAAPVAVGSYALGGAGRGVTLAGKYAYVAADSAGLQILDINGISSPAANIGSLASNNINISDSLNVGGDIYAGGGLDVGISGIYSRGALGVLGTTTLQNFTGVNATTTNATTTELAISGIASSLLKTLSNGAVVAAQAGVDYATPANVASAYPFTPSTFGINVSATTTPILDYPGLITSTSTIGTLVASSSITNQSVKSALVLNGAGGLEGAYGGSNCTSNQFATAITATGGCTSAAVSGSYFGNVGANTVFENQTGASGNPSFVATTTGLFAAGTAGQILMYTGSTNGYEPFSTTTFANGTGITNTFAGNQDTIACPSCALFGYDWTPATNYATNANSTTTPVWFKYPTAGNTFPSLMASSTSYFDQIQVGSTTANNNGRLATSTFYGNVDVKGYIEDDTVTNSLVFDGSGGTLGTYGGSNCSSHNYAYQLSSAGALTCSQITLTTDVTGTLPPANGGTGVANNAASTVTISGAYALSLTLSNTTSLTLPTSGTVCTTATCDTFAFPFTSVPTFGATLANATSTLIGFTNGIYALASSTIGNGAQAGGLTISGGATTTGKAYFAGSVGINNTSPSYALDVSGFINTDQYSGYKQNGATILYASSTLYSTLVGINAGSYPGTSLTSTATGNTFVGYNAASPGVAISGKENTALGYGALDSVTSGFGNVAVGVSSLGDTTGSNNVAVGNTAMQSASGASSEIAIGVGALKKTTGSSDVAIGTLALQNQTSGTGNFALGKQALNDLVTGTYNIAIGTQAGYNVLGSYNIALGYNAGGSNTDFNNNGNTSIGTFAGQTYATGAAYNTLLGYQSGYNVTSGAKNIQIGSYTTTANANITTGSNNIIIGNDVQAPSATASNQLNIGNLIFGTGLTGTGSTIAGNVGIGSTSPASTLTVVGSLCVDKGPSATTACGTTAGNAYGTAFNTGAYDVAENYLSSDATTDTPGTIVALDQATSSTVTIAGPGAMPFGVVSTNPGVLLGGADAAAINKSVVPVALSGRVPVTVDFEGGAISVGDPIALSNVAGVGTKATTTVEIVGFALESASSTSSLATTSIEVFIQPQLWLASTSQASLLSQFASAPQTLQNALTSALTAVGSSSVRELGAVAHATLGVFNNLITQTLTATTINADVVNVGQKLCIGATCVTEVQLQQLLQNSNSNNQSSNNQNNSGTSTPTVPPTITINGNNPATINIGDTYADLGATVTDAGPGQAGDSNLDIYMFVNGSSVQTVTLDTSTSTTYSIDYVATDSAGLTATSTRTVNVVAQ